MSLDPAKIRWMDRDGKPIACVEKLKVLSENLLEFRQVAADVLADAVLIGCIENDVRSVLRTLVDELESPFPVKAS